MPSKLKRFLRFTDWHYSSYSVMYSDVEYIAIIYMRVSKACFKNV